MSSPFKKAALAFTFSPSREKLLLQASRLVAMFGCEIIIYHVGEKSADKEEQINTLCRKNDALKSPGIRWLSGDPAKAIIRQGEKDGIDLLIMGALEKESAIKYLMGSVARDILRHSRFSVFCFTDPGVARFDKIVTAIDYVSQYERAARITGFIAVHDNPSETYFVKDVYIPALSSLAFDSGSSDEVEKIRSSYLADEEQKLSLFLKESNIRGFDYKIKALYGREAYETQRFTMETEADLLIFTLHEKKLTLLDRIFTHDAEFIFEDLPSNLLLLKNSR